MPLTKTRQAVWPSTVPKVSAPRIIVFSLLNSPARPYRCRRFACTLTSADARLAEKRGSVTPSFRGTSTPYLPPVRLAHQNMTLRDIPDGRRRSLQLSPRPERSGEPGPISRPFRRARTAGMGPGPGAGTTMGVWGSTGRVRRRPRRGDPGFPPRSIRLRTGFRRCGRRVRAAGSPCRDRPCRP